MILCMVIANQGHMEHETNICSWVFKIYCDNPWIRMALFTWSHANPFAGPQIGRATTAVDAEQIYERETKWGQWWHRPASSLSHETGWEDCFWEGHKQHHAKYVMPDMAFTWKKSWKRMGWWGAELLVQYIRPGGDPLQVVFDLQTSI